MREALMQAWRDRTLREQRIIGAGAVLLAIALAYAYLWLPVAREHERLLADVPRLRGQIERMRQDVREIERIRGSERTAPADLEATLTRFAAGQRLGNATPRISTEAGGKARVVLTAVRADAWLTWIGTLQIEHGIRVETASVEALEQAGMVKASATFSSGN